jgi:autotransporter-associated beta strand protein
MKSNVYKIDSRLIAGLKLIISALVLSIVFLLSPSARAQFTWPVYEPFSEYPSIWVTNDGEGDFTTNPYCLGDDVSSNFWNFGNPNQNWQVTNAAALSWPGLVADSNAVPEGIQELPENTTSADSGATFTPQTGTIFASFLLNDQDNSLATDDRCIFNIVTNAVAGNSDTHIFTSVWLAPDYGIVIDKDNDGGGTLSPETPALATGVPNLIVIRYKAVAGGNDEMDIWVNPPALGNDNLIPPPILSTTNGPNLALFNGLILSQRKTPNYQEDVFQIDEIRLGSDWATVTPATLAPGPLFGMTGGGTACAGTPLDVAVKGSVTTNVYELYTNGVYTGQSLAGTGGALDFGGQSVPGFYTVLASNAATAAVGWLTNSVTVAVIPSPSVVSEPVPVVTATNSRAEFKVVASGTGYSYQWYLNGNPVVNGTNITGTLTNVVTGALTNDLVISSASTANSGSYYCIISNACADFVITTTNTLTLDAPNNLVWSGDAFGLNDWAVGITVVPEFTDTNNNAAYFNEGDNVTFNDSYNGAQFGSTIILSNTLTPTSITFDTSQNLTWGGPGNISGTGSLLVNGSGTLTLNNNSAGSFANTFSGGTVISNGDVNMQNSWTGLGTGPLTLAGGTFETDQKSSGTGSTLGFPQNLLVTANSTWQVDKTGNQCAGLEGALLGNSGITLTITNSATTTKSANEIRFNGPFTNSLQFVLLENSLALTSSMAIGSFNTTTNIQVYNGSISGPTAQFIVSGSGPVYLNGVNTYTNPTVVNAGFLAGSGSVAGPLDVSSNTTVGAGSLDAIGTFSVNMGMVMTNGSKVFIRVNKALAQSNDLISVTGGVITNAGPGTGTVTITNAGTAPLVVGDTFQIFSQPVQNGAAFKIAGGGVTWANNLAANGSVQVAFGYVPLTSTPKILNFSLQSGNAVVNGTNGQAGATAFVLTTTNLMTPLNQWQTAATNILGGSGFTLTVTNAFTAGSPQRFFILSSTNYNP